MKEKTGSTTRKLIGHSGPVYSVAFDPLGGSSRSPRYLLSSSADSTARLWSLDTLSNVVAYRGHLGSVWDVTWSPLGIYFATGSRDRTARLWSTDRIAPLRIYAGHLSDVDVRGPKHSVLVVDGRLFSVLLFIPTLSIWLQVLAIGHAVYGMFKKVPVFVCSLVIKDLFLLSQ